MAGADELKQQGNHAFCAGDFALALERYSSAIEIDPQNHVRARQFFKTPTGDMSSHGCPNFSQLLFGNRSAAHYKNEDFVSASEDAAQAIKLKPDWSKGHTRLAQALERVGQLQEALTAIRKAQELEPSNSFIATCAARISHAYFHEQLKAPLDSLSSFLRVYALSDSIRLRLATLATFWNICSQSERYAVFAQLLPAVQAAGLAAALSPPSAASAPPPSLADAGGSSEPEATAASGGPSPQPLEETPGIDLAALKPSDVPESAMVQLPMHNYADVALPSEWLHWFETQSAPQRLQVFQGIWGECSQQERLLVAGDILHFMSPANASGSGIGSVGYGSVDVDSDSAGAAALAHSPTAGGGQQDG